MQDPERIQDVAAFVGPRLAANSALVVGEEGTGEVGCFGESAG